MGGHTATNPRVSGFTLRVLSAPSLSPRATHSTFPQPIDRLSLQALCSLSNPPLGSVYYPNRHWQGVGGLDYWHALTGCSGHGCGSPSTSQPSAFPHSLKPHSSCLGRVESRRVLTGSSEHRHPGTTAGVQTQAAADGTRVREHLVRGGWLAMARLGSLRHVTECSGSNRCRLDGTAAS
jgi:hypothetical protein